MSTGTEEDISKEKKYMITNGNVLTTNCNNCVFTCPDYFKYYPSSDNIYPLKCNNRLSSKYNKDVHADFLCEWFWDRTVYWYLAPRVIEDFNKFKVDE